MKKSLEFSLSKLAALILALIILIAILFVLGKYGKFFFSKIKEFLNMF